MQDLIYNDECLEDLKLDGLFLIQKNNGFRFGVDAVLLADFAAAKRKDSVVDLGCGTGIIPILIAHNFKPKSVKGIEILPHYAQMAMRSIVLNNLDEKVKILCGDYKNKNLMPPSCATLVTSNPPYQKVDACLHSPDSDKALARSEFNATLSDTVMAAARLLSPGGRFCMVHRPERLSDAICCMRENGLEPKRLKMVLPKANKAPALFLIEGLRGGLPGLKMLPALVINNEDGSETEEIRKIYRRGH